ncbi:MAG: hypothetical protein IK130_11030 [Oscillospiraceae bacterium]|nr:hypothetical protein [Oscillospiraceae bacterium]
MEQYDFDQLWDEINRMASGDAKLRAIRKAASEAELHNDNYGNFWFHHALIKESVFSGDRYQALIDFPQFLQIADSDEEIYERSAHTLLWVYKWILEATTEFYQIEKMQILRWFSDYRKRLLNRGYTLRSFYEKRAGFYAYADRAKLRLDYEDFLAQEHDRMSDGDSDEHDSMVFWNLTLGNREKAFELAEKVFREGWETDETPSTTYGYMLEDAMEHGDRERADRFAKLLRPRCDGSRFRMEEIGKMLCYDAWTDPAAGLQWIKKQQALRDGSRNPYLCFYFDRGASMLFDRAAKAGLGDADALSRKSAELRQSSQALAEKFDARNGSDYFTKRLAVFDGLH